ncbi:MAG: protein phosphatase 2C domain-containing protein [Eubacterium sp.]|nr:protein phosphatase 2C domain-containing protein [Eubacterium sp.]
MNTFAGKYDFLFLIHKEAVEGKGEDSFYCCADPLDGQSAAVAVFDGSGGAGSRIHEEFGGHTEAYIASRCLSGAMCDWYHENGKGHWRSAVQLRDSLKTSFEKAFSLCSEKSDRNRMIMGSMVKSFPTTAAIAYAQEDPEGILVHIMWAGDSRVYLMDREGLAQLTEDDLDGQDALANLYDDGVMTNMLSSDEEVKLHAKSFRISGPTLIFAATDGCFGYFPTPMDFEYVILSSLDRAGRPDRFKENLKAWFTEYAGDDFAMGLMSFYHGDFRKLKKTYAGRTRYIYNRYIEPLSRCREENRQDTETFTAALWEDYRTGYERYLQKENES